jgi:outer membrane immunogenic protein
MQRIKYTLIGLMSATALGGAAHAGSLADSPVEAPVYSPAPAPMAVAPVGEWTGFYTGLQLGYADVDGPGALDGDNGTYGFHAGYDYDFGSFVLGGELDYDKTDVDLGGVTTIDSVARAKLKAGYDLGSTLVYATAGAARADIDGIGDESGNFYGIGANYMITDRYTVGAELLQHKFDDIGGVAGADADATTFTVRGSLRF